MKTEIALIVAIALIVLAASLSWKNMQDEVEMTTSPMTSISSTSPRTPQRIVRSEAHSEFEPRILTGIETTLEPENDLEVESPTGSCEIEKK